MQRARVVHADEAASWSDLDERLEIEKINHKKAIPPRRRMS
jgi:hypothetical protein